MSAAMLRQAAAVVEERARLVSPPPWSGYVMPNQGEMFCGPWDGGYLTGSVMAWPDGAADEFGGLPTDADMTWIETMGPQIASPLAAWLSLCADQADHTGTVLGPDHPGVALARALLGNIHRLSVKTASPECAL